VLLRGKPQPGPQRQRLGRREFLKGIVSLGGLAVVSYLVSPWWRGNQPAPGMPPLITSPLPNLSGEPLSETILPTTPSALHIANEEAIIASERTLAASQPPFAVLYGPGLKEYNFGPNRLFRGRRYGQFIQFLQENLPEANNYRILKADPATDEDLLLISPREYIDFSRRYYEAANLGLEPPAGFSKFHGRDNKPDWPPGKIEHAARIIVGQAKMACDLVQEGKFTKAISIGGGLHHAGPSQGEGFSIYNDVAFCAKYLLHQYNLERILILDVDAHAGNGTSAYFYDDPRVLLIDLHQDPKTIYPGTGFANEIGTGAGTGFTINIPLPPYASDSSYRLAFESVVEPVTREFKPQIIIANGGADPHFADSVAYLGLTLAGFRMIGEKIGAMSSICDGKVVTLLVSGYNEEVRPLVWLSIIAGLNGIEFDAKEPLPIPESIRVDYPFATTQRIIKEVKGYLREYWHSLR